METIQQFKSFCGKIFNTIEECIRYEDISKQVNNILNAIENSDKYDEDCQFSNGKGFVQHPRGTKDILEKEIVRLSNEWFNNKEPFTQFSYYLRRCIDDSSMSCLNKLSYKLMCIDELEREYGQPYYCVNPSQVKGGRLN